MTRQSRIILHPSQSQQNLHPCQIPKYARSYLHLLGKSPTRSSPEPRRLFLARSEPDQRFIDLELRAIGEFLLFAERAYIRVEEDFEILTQLEEKPEDFSIVVVLEPGDGSC